MIDFLFLIPSGTPNNFLACLPAYCQASEADMAAPQFQVSADQVKSAWDATIAAQPRVTLKASDRGKMQFSYVQRSAIFRFPDLITVRFVGEDEGRATRILMYSRAKYGYSDFGVNKRRVVNWLEQLGRELDEARQERAGPDRLIPVKKTW